MNKAVLTGKQKESLSKITDEDEREYMYETQSRKNVDSISKEIISTKTESQILKLLSDESKLHGNIKERTAELLKKKARIEGDIDKMDEYRKIQMRYRTKLAAGIGLLHPAELLQQKLEEFQDDIDQSNKSILKKKVGKDSTVGQEIKREAIEKIQKALNVGTGKKLS